MPVEKNRHEQPELHRSEMPVEKNRHEQPELHRSEMPAEKTDTNNQSSVGAKCQ